MEHIIETLIEDEMRTSYIDYAMSVIIGRALPDVRDGLKPVQRRILYAMRELGLMPNKPYRKSATVVGEVIGKYHPHGDLPVYDALVRMAQDFSLRYPLIDGQGNFGSIDGDPPAAYRYTEARLAPVAMEMLEGLDEDTVDFMPNFDGRLKEPVVLPAGFPNLLANGSSGIAVGMATNIPPHNLNELIDGFVALIDNPAITDEELLTIVKGPDFPTGAEILGTSGIRQAYLTGRGRIKVRAKVKIEEKRGRSTIVVTEIPYQVSKSLIIEKIAELVKNKKIEGIADLRDESDREGLRIVIELKRGVQAQVILNQLFMHTPLQVTYGIILLALVDGVPKVLSLRQMMDEFLRHREVVVQRRTSFRLRKAEARAHVLEGFRKALEHLDEIITLIRSSNSPSEAKTKLISMFGFTEKQAQAILELKLHQLTRLEREKIDSEYEQLLKDIERYKSILANRRLLLEVIKDELLKIKAKYGDKRRTVIVEAEPQKIAVEDLIQREDVIVTVTHDGYVKRTPVRYYKSQGRGGIGRSGITLYENDFPIIAVKGNTHHFIMFFTDHGRAYTIKTYELPEGTLQAKGRPLRNFINIKNGERITAAISFEDFSPKLNVFLATKSGIVKRMPLNLLKNSGRSGVYALKFKNDDDYLIGAILTSGDDIVVLARANGYAIAFHESKVRKMGRMAHGVKGAKQIEGGEVVSLLKIEPGKNLLTITENGYGKKVPATALRISGRGTKGIIIQRVNEKTGKLVKVMTIDGDDDALVLTQAGTVIRFKGKDVRVMGRYAVGIRMIKLREGDKVVDLAVIEREKDKA